MMRAHRKDQYLPRLPAILERADREIHWWGKFYTPVPLRLPYQRLAALIVPAGVDRSLLHSTPMDSFSGDVFKRQCAV